MLFKINSSVAWQTKETKRKLKQLNKLSMVFLSVCENDEQGLLVSLSRIEVNHWMKNKVFFAIRLRPVDNKTWLLVKLDFFELQSLDNFKSELVYCWFTKCSLTNQIHFSFANTPWVCTCTWLGFYQTIMTCFMKSVSTLFSAVVRVVSITLMQSKIILLIAWATISYFLLIQVWFLSRTVGPFKNLQCPGL